MAGALSDKEIQEIRSRFRAWVLWLLEERPDKFPTRVALAKAIGCTGASITQWTSGTRSPALDSAIAVARVAGHSLDYLLGHEPPPPRPEKRR